MPDADPRAFVGRKEELESLESALQSSTSGRARVVLIGGPPGIGKTRTSEEFAQRARKHGCEVLTGSCVAGEGPPAYWPWVRMLRSYVQRRPPDAPPTTLGEGSSRVIQFVEAGCTPRRTMSTPPQEGLQERFVLFDGIASALTHAAAEQPLVLLLDDLHSADRSSLLLLEFVAREAREARLLIVGTYRDTEVGPPLAATLVELTRQPHVVRIDLRGLPESDATQLALAVAERALHPNLVRRIVERSDGNPLFLIELVRSCRSGGGPREGGDQAPSRDLPVAIRATIEDRLRHISGNCRTVLQWAALTGREFDVGLLECTTGTRAEALLAAMDEAVAARLVQDTAGAPERFAFEHPLIREVLYASLSPLERAQGHRRLGVELEHRIGRDPSVSITALAHHFGQAASLGEAARAARYTIAAADQARERLAYEEGCGLYGRSLELLALAGISEEQQRCEILLGLGECQFAAGQPQEGRRTFEEVAELARGLGRGELMARAAIGCGLLADRLRVDARLIELLESALITLTDDHPSLRANTLVRLAVALRHVRDSEARRQMLCDEAVALAERAGESRILALVLFETRMAVWDPGGARQRAQAAQRIVDLASLGPPGFDRTYTFLGHICRASDLIELGDRAGFEREMHILASLAPEVRGPFPLVSYTFLQATKARVDGRFAESEELAGRALEIGRRSGHPFAEALFATQMSNLIVTQGRLEGFPLVVAGAREFMARYPALTGVRCGLACALAVSGDEAACRLEFEGIAADGFRDLLREVGGLPSLALLAPACSFLRDRGRAALLYELMRPYAGVNLFECWGGVAYGPVSYYLALLATTMAEWSAARQHFEEALSLSRELGARPYVAEAACEFARMLVERFPGDHARAQELLAEAELLGEQLGMELLLKRVRELQSLMDGRAQRAVTSVLNAASAVGAGSEPHVAGDDSSPRVVSLARHREARLDQATRPAAGTSGAADEGLCRREGEYWTISVGRSLVRLRDSKGLRCLAQLLAHPNQDFFAGDLAVFAADGSSAVAPVERSGVERGTGTLGDAGESVDSPARAAYRRRLEDLKGVLKEAQELGDLERAARVREEAEALARELARSVGLGGRGRRSGSHAERARVSVTRTLKDALRRIGEGDPALGRYLTVAIKTGTFCRYTPDPQRPVVWRF